MLVNRSRTVDWMERSGLDALIATHWVNVLYLSDYHIWIQPPFKEYMLRPGASDAPLPLFAVLPRQGEPAIVLDQSCELNASGSWVRDRYVYGSVPDESAPPNSEESQAPEAPSRFARSNKRYAAALDALAAVLQDRGLRDARLGIDLRHLPLEQHSVIRSALPHTMLREASDLFRLIRMVKSQEELCRLRMAASISEDAAMNSLRSAKPGADIQEIVHAFRAGIASQGADFDHFAFSRRGIGMATDISAELDRPETLYIDFGCIYRHYYSDAGLTLMTGQPSARDTEICRQLAGCLEEARTAMKPGAKASTIQALMARHFETHGLHGHFPHGHSLGIEIREYPILASSDGRMIRDDCVSVSADLPLEVGMVINLETPVFELSESAFQLEQSFVITADGGEPLTGRHLSEPLVIQ